MNQTRRVHNKTSYIGVENSSLYDPRAFSHEFASITPYREPVLWFPGQNLRNPVDNIQPKPLPRIIVLPDNPYFGPSSSSYASLSSYGTLPWRNLF